MKPISFAGHNRVYGKTLPAVNHLPVFMSDGGVAVSCWRMSWRERAAVLLRGVVWVVMVTKGKTPMPHGVRVSNPLIRRSALHFVNSAEGKK